MRSKILKCTACGQYTLRDECPRCKASTVTTKPARFSPEDPYGRDRRALNQSAKAERLDERNLSS